MNGNDPRSLSQADAARILGKTGRTLRYWTDQGAPRNADGTYSIPDLVEWLITKSASSGGDLNLEAERARLAKEQADKTALENEVRRGRLVEAEEVLRTWTDLIAAARARLLAMPSKLGPMLTNVGDANVAASRIREEVYAALSELAEPVGSSSGSSADNLGAASDVDARGLGGHSEET